MGKKHQSFHILTRRKKRFIIEKLVSYFQESLDAGDEYDKIICEMRGNYDVLVIKLNTDVDILPEDNYEDMLGSGLIDVVRDAVYNYDEVYNDAMMVLSMLKNRVNFATI